MLLQIFKAILLTSLVGSVLAIILLLIKPVTKRYFGSAWQYYVWLTVLVVMMLPVTIKLPQPASFPPASQTVQQSTTETAIQTETETQAIPMQATNITPFYDTVNKVKDISLGITDIICYIWLMGCLLILGLNIIKYSVFLRAIRKNSVIISCPEIETEKIITRKTSMIDAPLMIGLFKPTLILPDLEMTQENLNYILLHELTHYRRHDLLYKWFAMLVSTVHWFNPFVYIVSKQIDEECETSCDLSVVAEMNEQEQTGYMNTILTLVAQTGTNRKALTTAMASSKKQIKRRFMMIRTMRKTKKITAVISVITAYMILATTVFASGVLANVLGIYDNKDYKAFVYKGDEKMDVTDKMIIQNQEIFLPLRAVLNFHGIDDIQWDNGRIQIGFPVDEKVAAYDYMQYSYANRCDFIIGENVAYLSLDEEGRGGQNLSDAPFLINGVTYVPQFVFESLSHYGQFLDYRFELHQPTNPESYYEKDEEVFIGTPIEQADYVPTYENGNVKIIKRIIVNDNGEVMAVITAQNQTQEVLDNIAPAYTFDLSIGGPQEFYDCFIGNANRYQEKHGYHLWSNITVKNKLKSIAYIPPIYQINVHKYAGTEVSDYYVQ